MEHGTTALCPGSQLMSLFVFMRLTQTSPQTEVLEGTKHNF